VDQTRAAAQRLEVVSLFNLWLQDRASGLFRELRMSLRALDSEDAAILFIRGVVSRLEGKTDVAVEYWREGVSKYGSSARSCQDALQAIGEAPINPSRQSAVQRIRAILDRSEDRLDSSI